jgi:hypothetical protein
MNQRDATVTVIEFFRSSAHGCEAVATDKALDRAVKVLEKRAEVLGTRLQRRRADPPGDILDEPLNLPRAVIMDSYRSELCPICDGKKYRDAAFCVPCFDKLDPSLRKAFKSGTTFFHAFCRAMQILKPA